MKDFYSKYDGSKFPKDDIARNVLKDFGVPHDRLDEALKIVIENAKYTGVMTEIGGNQYIQLGQITERHSAPQTQTMEIQE